MLKKIMVPLILMLMMTTQSLACWISLSMEEMIHQADVIIIGEIGPNTEKVKTDVEGHDNTRWEVNVWYTLKGDNHETMYVETEGAEGNEVQISIDYKLNQVGNQVLLFLNEHEGTYSPITPQAIIAIAKNDTAMNEEQESSQSLLNLITFDLDNFEQEDKDTLYKFIQDNPNIMKNTDESLDRHDIIQEENSEGETSTPLSIETFNTKDHSTYMWIGGAFTSILVIGTLIIKIIKH